MATPEPTSTLVAGMASFNGLIPIFGTTGSSGVSETESGLMVIPSYNNWLSRLNSSSYKTTGPTGGWEQEWWTVYNYLQYGGICVVGATGSTGNYYSASGVLTASNTPLHNKNLVNLDVVFSGGSTFSAAAAASIANTRQDCLAFLGNYKTISSPGAYVAGSTAHFQDFGVTAGSEYICYFVGRKKSINDVNTSSTNLITTNTGADAAGCFARTLRIAKPWSTIAGTVRGRVLSAVTLDQIFDDSVLSGFAAAKVNAIQSITNSGFSVMGNKTGYTGASVGLNRLDTMNMIIYIKKQISDQLNQFLFSSNNSQTRLSILNIINPLLQTIKDSEQLVSYSVVCDETNNTSTVISNGQLVVDISLKQSSVAESIVLNFIIETSI